MAPVTILWDNDGVLVDTERLYFDATRETMARAGWDLSFDDFQRYFLIEGRGAWHLLGLDDAAVRRWRGERDDLYAEKLRTDAIAVPGAEEVLRELHGRVAMGIVTSSKRTHFELIHSRTNLLRYIDFVITIDDVTRGKPDPEPYLRAVERAAVPASDCLAIEDSHRGLASAKAAGLRCWVIPTALTRSSDLSAADRTLDSIHSVPATVSLS